MKTFSLFVFLLLIPLNIYSQTGWLQQNSGTNKRLSSCFFINEHTGFAGGTSGVLLKTTNGGTNWNNTLNRPEYDVLAIYFINGTGWAVVIDNIENDSVYIFKSISYGIIWTKYNLDSSRGFNFGADIQFVNFNTGYVTTNGKFYKSTNGGLNWFKPAEFDVGIGLFFTDDLNGWICKTPNGIYKTTNGGINWGTQEFFWYHQYVVDICFINSQKGFCLSRGFGSEGPMFTTTNGGINWYYQLPQTLMYSSLKFTNQNTGYMIAADVVNNRPDKVAKTTNGGANWLVYEVNTPQRLIKLFFPSSNTGWVVGDSGTILKTTNGGVTIGIHQISSEVPRNFSLSQNYPNPFNPVTNIEFDIPESGHIRIAVYDLLGKEISVIVNETLKAGVYEADFDASNLPSGVYFYRLDSEGYSQTRKMVLLK